MMVWKILETVTRRKTPELNNLFLVNISWVTVLSSCSRVSSLATNDGSAEAAIALLTMGDLVLQSEIGAEQGDGKRET